MALPNGQIFSRKYIFDNSYILVSEEEEAEIAHARHKRCTRSTSIDQGCTADAAVDGYDSDSDCSSESLDNSQSSRTIEVGNYFDANP